jgi:hypothetical protein
MTLALIHSVRKHFALGLAIIACFIIIIACSGGSGVPRNDSPAGGAIALEMLGWRGNGATAASIPRALSGDICTDFGIESVSAAVYDEGGNPVATAEAACDQHQLTLDGIPVGDGYRVVGQGLVAGNTCWQGETTGITVTADSPAETVTIEMIYQCMADSPPFVVATLPAADATGQPSTPTLFAVFSEAMSPASINAASFALSAGSTSVPGVVVYDADTLTATLSPEDALAPETTYTAALTTAIEDLDGNPLAENYTWTFTTERFPVYTIAATATAGGGIDPSGAVVVSEGARPRFTFSADEGFFIESVTVNGTIVPVADSYQFTAVSADQSIHVAFKRVWYVDGDLGGGGDGRTWATALDTIPGALSRAASGEEIWIRNGTYLLATQLGINTDVILRGGFAGDEHYPQQRDPATYATIIDGNAGGRGLFIAADAGIDGMTLQNCAISGSTPQGGAIYIDGAAPTITDCRILNSTAGPSDAKGGAVYINQGAPRFRNCRFLGNRVSGATEAKGGAVYVYHSGAGFIGCEFIDNGGSGANGDLGGAIYNDASSTVINGCRFLGNSAGGESGYGGAIYNDGSSAEIVGSFFSGNFAGGLSGRGGAVYNSASPALIANCGFQDNLAGGRYTGEGGALYNANSDASIVNCTLFRNAANTDESGYTAYGAGVYNLSSDIEVINSILWDNTATSDGDGVRNRYSQIYDGNAASATVNHCDIDQNGFTDHGNIRQPPLFAGDLHLRSESPCIDMADSDAAPDVDVDDEVRPLGSAADMGFDEFADSDGDGLPDFWEAAYGLDLDLTDAGADPDADSLSNLNEYVLGTNPQVATPLFAAQGRGAYRDDGYHDPADGATLIGATDSADYRAYLSFDLSELSATVGAASLRLELVGYDSIDPSESLEIWEVATDAGILESGSASVPNYEDLGDGRSYGHWTFTPADVGTVLEIPLGPAAVAEINAAAGGAFALGLTLEDYYAGQRVRFSEAGEARVQQLVLSTP